MAKIAIATANLAQLTAFAGMALGLDIPDSPAPTKASLRALIATAFSGDEIDVEDASVAGGAKAPLTIEDVKTRKLVLINIPVQENVAGGNDAVPVGVNGTVARIQRGVNVEVPLEYVEVLLNAVKKVPIKDQDSKITGWTDAAIYPFSILGAIA